MRRDGFWCYVEPAGCEHRDQGWKIHLGATPLSAPLILARAAEILVERRCLFKFAAGLNEVANLVAVRADRGSGGKFITVYPRCDEEFTAVAEALHQATRGLPGPGILSDRCWSAGSLVHFRYGAMSRRPELTDDGAFTSLLVGPNGERVKDERNAWFSPPPWARSPFGDAQPVHAPKKPSGVLLADRFEVKKAIRHANKGGVYRAHDRMTGREVVIKGARAHVGSNLLGTDVRDLLRHEADMLELLAPSGITPSKIELFEQQDSSFLVQELIPGVPLRRWVHEKIADSGHVGGLPLSDAIEKAATGGYGGRRPRGPPAVA